MSTSDQPQFTLAMIGRNNEQTAQPCSSSFWPFVDRFVVVDTGSVGRTPDVAAKYAAETYHFPWCKDFSAARNESLKYACGKDVLWADTDDTVDLTDGRKTRELAYATHAPRVITHTIQVESLGGADSGVREAAPVGDVKFFRNLPEIQLGFRVHEQLFPSICRLGAKGNGRNCCRHLARIQAQMRE